MKGAYKTSPRPSREFFSNNSYAYQSNGMSQKTSSPRSRTPERKIRDSKENNCIICSKSTQLCCFNCKRVYYCSADHQQIHWESHQTECSAVSARLNKSPRNTDKRSTSPYRSNPQYQRMQHSGNMTERSSEANTLNSTNRNLKDKYTSENIKTATINGGNTTRRTLNETQRGNEDMNNLPEVVERQQQLTEAIYFYKNLDLDKAAIRAQRAYELSKYLVLQVQSIDFYQLIADGLLLAKLLIAANKMSQATQLLNEIWINLQNKIENIKWHKLIGGNDTYRSEVRYMLLVDDKGSSQRKQIENNKEMKKVTSILSSIGALFFSTGDLLNCEAAYLKYLDITEKSFGSDSLEVSDCLFLIGVFYLENKMYGDSLKALTKALNLRKEHYHDEKHVSIADCYYNIAIIHKAKRSLSKALNAIDNSLKIRAQIFGEVSLPVSETLELAGKIYFENNDLEESFIKLQDCFIIRQKISDDLKDPDAMRIKSFIKAIFDEVAKRISEDEGLTIKEEESYERIYAQIEKSALYKDLNLTRPLKAVPSSLKTTSKASPKIETNLEENYEGQDQLLTSSLSSEIQRTKSPKYEENHSTLKVIEEANEKKLSLAESNTSLSGTTENFNKDRIEEKQEEISLISPKELEIPKNEKLEDFKDEGNTQNNTEKAPMISDISKTSENNLIEDQQEQDLNKSGQTEVSFSKKIKKDSKAEEGIGGDYEPDGEADNAVLDSNELKTSKKRVKKSKKADTESLEPSDEVQTSPRKKSVKAEPKKLKEIEIQSPSSKKSDSPKKANTTKSGKRVSTKSLKDKRDSIENFENSPVEKSFNTPRKASISTSDIISPKANLSKKKSTKTDKK